MTRQGKVSNSNQHNASNAEQKVGAGIASGIFGYLIGGPVIGLILGFATSLFTERNGIAGDMARAVGEVALTARDKAREVNRKHNIIS